MDIRRFARPGKGSTPDVTARCGLFLSQRAKQSARLKGLCKVYGYETG